MKNLFALITLLAMLVQTFRMGIIEVDFYINQKQIAEQLCENKDKPELECNGHCQLKKELEKDKKPESRERFQEVGPYLGTGCTTIVAPDHHLKISKINRPVIFTYQDYISEILHPPGVLFHARA